MRAGAFIAAGLLFGCASPRGSYFTDTSPDSWRKSITVAFPNADTLSTREISIALRCNEMFRDDTLSLHVALLSPDSLRYEEPVVLRIPRGRYAAPVSREIVIPYRQNSVLADSGEYLFTFTPMRSVRGIEAVGLIISEHND